MAENWADTTRTAEYQANVEFALNETPGKLASWCGSKGSHEGASVEITDRFSDINAEDIETRNADTVNTDPDVERRWMLKPKRASVAPLLDPDDVMSTSVDIKSPLVMGVARGVRRRQDDAWLEGFYGTAYTGEKGVTGVPFKSANILAVDFSTTGTPTGLTLNKLIRIRRLMGAAFVDLETERPIMPVTAAQVEDLMKIPEYRSRDYNAMMPLMDGKVVNFMGFTFVPCEYGNAKAFPKGSSLTVDGSGYRRVPVFVPSGMHRGSWLEFDGKIDLRADKNHSTQIAGYTAVGCTRLNEDKCFQVLCAES